MPVYEGPLELGAYVYSKDVMVNVATPNNYVSLFNPGGALLIVTGVFLSNTLFTSSSIADSLRGYRTTTATGGTDRSADIAKGQTRYPTAAGVIRTDNPTVTLGPALFNSPSPIQDKANWVHSVGVGSLQSPFVLAPNEGLVVRSLAGIGVGANWNITFVWNERVL